MTSKNTDETQPNSSVQDTQPNSSVQDTQPNSSVQETQPVSSVKETQPVQTGGKSKRWPWILLGIFLVIVGLAAGAYIGYLNAITIRMNEQSNEVAVIAATQFQMAQMDVNNKNYGMARKRLEYVLQLDTKFPGATQLLTEVLVAENTLATNTPIPPTPTVYVTPTPDLRGEDEIYQHAYNLMRAKDWFNALDTLDILRIKNRSYKALEVDGLYYIGLRQRGVTKILMGNLEEGIYDLSLTERYGPIDGEADGLRNSARYYLLGATFWEVDWSKVVNYFGQLYPMLPSLRDSSGWTVAERFRKGSIYYGDQLMAAKKYCDGRNQYQSALGVANDDVLAPTATKAQLLCEPPTNTPLPVTETPTPTNTVEYIPPTDTETPTETPTTP